MEHTKILFTDSQAPTPATPVHVDVDKFVEKSLKKKRKKRVDLEPLLIDLDRLLVHI